MKKKMVGIMVLLTFIGTGMVFAKPEKCKACDGKKKVTVSCPRCGGKGEIRLTELEMAKKGTLKRTEKCTTCKGKGKWTEKCETCDGKGKIGLHDHERTLRLTLAGIDGALRSN